MDSSTNLHFLFSVTPICWLHTLLWTQ